MKSSVMSAIALVGTLGACAMAPERNASIEQARLAVSQIQNDAQVTRNAPVELARAQETLREAERVWSETPRDAMRIDHLAYVAGRRAALAQEVAGMKAAEQVVEQTSRDRDRMLLQARTREAAQAREQVAASETEVESARRATQSAREQAQAQQQMTISAEQRSARLQQQLNDLQAQETERGFNVMLSGVLFESGAADLKPGAAHRLEQLAEVLRENPDHVALVEGFTDSVGDENFNEELSERRAQAVRDALASLGVDPSRIQVQGYGEDYPVASNRTPAGRQQNRRVEIVVSGDNVDIPPRGFVGRSGGETRGKSGKGHMREMRDNMHNMERMGGSEVELKPDERLPQ